MASFELVSLSSSDAEDFDDDTNELLRARHAREDLLIMKILANTFQKRTMSRSRSMRCPNVPTGVRI